MKISDIHNEISMYYAKRNQASLLSFAIPMAQYLAWFYRKVMGDVPKIQALKTFLKSIKSSEIDRDLTISELFCLIQSVYINNQYQYETLFRWLSPIKLVAIEWLYEMKLCDEEYVKIVIEHEHPEMLVQVLLYLAKGKHCIPEAYFLLMISHKETLGAVLQVSRLFDHPQKRVPLSQVCFILRHADPRKASEVLSILHYANLTHPRHLKAIPVSKLEEVYEALLRLEWSAVSLTEKSLLTLCRHPSPLIAAQGILNAVRTDRMECLYLPIECTLTESRRTPQPVVAPIRIPDVESELDVRQFAISTSRSP